MIAGMVLCAGFGTRMGKYTENCPKPMLEVGGKPVLYYTLMNLKKAGIKDVFINLHYLSDVITDYFGDGSTMGLNIKYSYEEKPLGTAGALLNIKDQLLKYEKIVCLYGDILSNQDLKKLVDFHQKSESELTFFTHVRNKSNSVVVSDNNGKVIQFLERPDDEELKKSGVTSPYKVNSAIYCLEASILKSVNQNLPSDFPKDIFPQLLSSGKLYELPLDGYRVAIDSEERLLSAREDVNNPEHFWELKA